MKTVLFIGSNPSKASHHMPAKDLGCRIVLVKDKPVDKDYKIFDEVIKADLFDVEKFMSSVIEFDKKVKIDACLTRFEPYVPHVGMVCERLGLIGPSLNSALNARDKLKMREALAAVGVGQPKFIAFETVEELRRAADKLGYPFVIKPLSGAKSRYIKKIINDSEIESAFKIVRDGCRGNKENLFANFRGMNGYDTDYTKVFLAEELIRGKQVTTTSLVFGGKVVHLGVADLVTAQDKGIDAFYLISRTVPSRLSDEIQKEICRVSTAAVKALGLDDTPLHPEFILTDDGVKVIEVAARIGGYRTEMTELATGVKLNEAAVRIALGMEPDLAFTKNRSATAVEIWPRRSGVVREIMRADSLKHHVKMFTVKNKIGDEYNVPPVGEKPIGSFIVEDETDSYSKAEMVLDRFKYVIS